MIKFANSPAASDAFITRPDRLTIDVNRAGAAKTHAAAELRSFEIHFISQTQSSGISGSPSN